MQENTQTKITRAAMETELGDSYKRCWAYAFKYADEGLDFEVQLDNLCREFGLVKAQAVWFVNGACSILARQEAKESRAKPEKQTEILNFFGEKKQERFISELEMMSFLEDLDEMSKDADFSEYWQDIGQIKQSVLESGCATEKEVLSVFRIRSKVESDREQRERFFDAYPVSTDAWENGCFNVAGEIVY